MGKRLGNTSVVKEHPGGNSLFYLFPFKVRKAKTDKVLQIFGKLYGYIKVIANYRKGDGFVISCECIAAKTPDGS